MFHRSKICLQKYLLVSQVFCSASIAAVTVCIHMHKVVKSELRKGQFLKVLELKFEWGGGGGGLKM